MIQVKYGELPTQCLYSYFNFLINKFYKIMPLKENESKTLDKYLKGLQRELIGNSDLLLFLKDEPQFISLLNILQYFISENCSVNDCCTDVKRAIRIVKQIRDKYFTSEGEIKCQVEKNMHK